MQEIGAEYCLVVPTYNHYKEFRMCLGITKYADCVDDKRPIIAEFFFNSQCEKGEAYKKALLWLLDNSDIKKTDEKADKIAELQKQVDELNRKIEELR